MRLFWVIACCASLLGFFGCDDEETTGGVPSCSADSDCAEEGSTCCSLLGCSVCLPAGTECTDETCRAARDGNGAGGAGGGGAGGAGGGGGGVLREHLRLSYVKTVTASGGGQPVVDLVVYDFEDEEEFNLTAGQGIVDCSTRLCRLNSDMTWIGWLDSDQSAGGFKLMVAPVDVRRKEVRLDEIREVRNQVSNFEFTTYKDPATEQETEQIIYSYGQAAGSDGSIDVFVEPVEAMADVDCAEGGPLCRNLVGTINSDGAFRVTSFGSLIILVETTLSTMNLSFYNLSSGAQQTIYTFGEQNQTGSEFSGRLPIGLAPDASFLAVFTRDNFTWRVHALDARPNPPEPDSHELFTVQNAGDSCVRAMPYNFSEVRFNPVFSEDSEWIYFMAHGDCSRRPGGDNPPTNRDDYDILRINRRLEGPVENVTENLRASHWSNHDMGDFDLSPDGSSVVFTAQRRNDARSSSIWKLDVETGAYDCSRGDELPVIDGRARCEFIFDARMDATVDYRDLLFHRVMVPRD